MRTLNTVRANKLFILDEKGRPDYPGAYYLGEHGNYSFKEEIINFIGLTAKRLNVSKIITVGSSKGGWCALYFGFRLHAVSIFAGAPQYYLGDYLDCNFHQRTFEIMTGHDRQEDKKTMNRFLPDEISNYKDSIRVYLHYSDAEHTYFEHIQYLVKDMNRNKFIELNEDKMHYKNHSDVGVYFPRYVLGNLHSVI